MRKVISGVCSIPIAQHDDSSSLMRLMLHETHRVFRDRLVDAADRNWFDYTLDTICLEEAGAAKSFWHLKYRHGFHCRCSGTSASDIAGEGCDGNGLLLFCDFAEMNEKGNLVSVRRYQQSPPMPKLLAALQKWIALQAESAGKSSGIVVFA